MIKLSVTTADGRDTLHIERRFAHPVAKVWEALTRPQHLSAWYPLTTDRVELAVGATIEFDDGAGTTYLGEITEVEHGRVLAFVEDGTDEVRFELVADGDATVLRFTHSFTQGRPAQHATGWHNCFEILDALLAGRPLPARAHDDDLERHYAELLGQAG